MDNRRKTARRLTRRRIARSTPALAAFVFILIGLVCSRYMRDNYAIAAAQSRRIYEAEPRASKSENSSGGSSERNTYPAQDENTDWMLILVNADNPLPDGYSPKLKSLVNGLQFDERAIDRLNEMLAAARNAGLSPVVCSAYRTIEKQRALYNDKVSQLTARGLNQKQAEDEASRYVAYPGVSEHNLGLAVDIVAEDYQLLDEQQANTPEAKWLLNHCAEYGFILRYQLEKEAITGVTYEPWHFRYVGVTAAREIMENGLCLEEYLLM